MTESKTGLFNRFANWLNDKAAASEEKMRIFPECKAQISSWFDMVKLLVDAGNDIHSYGMNREEMIQAREKKVHNWRTYTANKTGKTPTELSVEEVYKHKGYLEKEQILLKLNNLEESIKLITAPFTNESVMTLCEGHKDYLLNPKKHEFYNQKFNIRDGIYRLEDLHLDFLPKGFSTQLTKFMTTNPAFLAFFEAHEILEAHEIMAKKIRCGSHRIPDGLAGFVMKAPAEERDEILSMMAENHLFKTALSKTEGKYFHFDTLSPDEMDTAIEERNAMVKTVAEYPFFKNVLGLTSEVPALTIYLARGLSPDEYEGMLDHTQIFADRPLQEGATLEHAQSTINDIAVEALMHSQPELYKDTKEENWGYYPPIDKVCDDQKAIWAHKKDATEIMRITFDHCKPEPKQTPDNGLNIA